MIRVLEPSSRGEIYTRLSYASRQIDRTCQPYFWSCIHVSTEAGGVVKTAKQKKRCRCLQNDYDAEKGTLPTTFIRVFHITCSYLFSGTCGNMKITASLHQSATSSELVTRLRPFIPFRGSQSDLQNAHTWGHYCTCDQGIDKAAVFFGEIELAGLLILSSLEANWFGRLLSVSVAVGDNSMSCCVVVFLFCFIFCCIVWIRVCLNFFFFPVNTRIWNDDSCPVETQRTVWQDCRVLLCYLGYPVFLLWLHVKLLRFVLAVCRLGVCVMYKLNPKQVRSELNRQVVGVMENRRLFIHVSDE